MTEFKHCAAATAMALALLAGCASPQRTAELPARQAWVQAAAAGGYLVRALTDADTCPTLLTDRGSQPMALRAAPAEVPPRPDGDPAAGAAARFAERVCEAAVPSGATRLAVGSIALPLPPAQVRRIVLLGDTGCRMKQSEDAFQDCNDAVAWPYATVARSAAAKHPDLVVHVGDYHYRESPCPPGRTGCAGSPWGYGADVWQADLFAPAAPLLAAAPWVFVRGNHESCRRAGVGWYRDLDARPLEAGRSCEQPALDREAEFSAPYSVPLDRNTQLIVFDSAFVAAGPYAPDDATAARYAGQLRQADALARQRSQSFFVNHHPILAFAGTDGGRPKNSGAGLRSVFESVHPARLFPDGVDLVINGHVHLFEVLDFASPYPAELLVGNGGSATEGHVDPELALHAEPAPGAAVRSFATQRGFGFATLDRGEASGWTMTEWDPRGEALRVCRLSGSRWDCQAPR